MTKVVIDWSALPRFCVDPFRVRQFRGAVKDYPIKTVVVGKVSRRGGPAGRKPRKSNDS